MNESQLAQDAMIYVSQLYPFWLIFGAIAFADLTTGFLIRLFKKAKGPIKW